MSLLYLSFSSAAMMLVAWWDSQRSFASENIDCGHSPFSACPTMANRLSSRTRFFFSMISSMEGMRRFSISVLAIFFMKEKRLNSRGVTNVTASPSLPARPVLPTRWM